MMPEPVPPAAIHAHIPTWIEYASWCFLGAVGMAIAVLLAWLIDQIRAGRR